MGLRIIIGGECTKRFFGGSLDFNSAKGEDITNKLDDAYFTDGSDSSSNPESCLIVNWDKVNGTGSSNNKWAGGFRWLWSFRKGNKGFVMFAEAKSTTTASTFDLNGGIYFIEKGDSTNWTIKKYKEITSQTINSTNTLDNFFPKIGTTLKNDVQSEISGEQKDYWGFVNGNSDLSNVCINSNGSSCPNQPTGDPTKAWMWLFKHGTVSNKVSDWSSNFGEWSNKLFDKTKIDLKNMLETFKGTWEKQTTTPTGTTG